MKILNVVGSLPFISACFFLCTVHLYGLTPSSYGEIFIVANKSVSAETLSAIDIQKIFLGNKTKLKDKTKISFVLQKPGETHKEFLKTYIKRSTAQFKNYWRQMVFSGKGRTPKSFATEEELIKFLSETKSTISYVSKAPSNENVKIIHIK